MIAIADLRTTLLEFASETRLYEFIWLDGRASEAAPQFIVEAFAADDRLQGIGQREVVVLCMDRAVDGPALLHRHAALQISLPDGSRAQFSGYVSDVQLLGKRERLARYRLRISSWLWRLAHARHCRVWQDKTVAEIVDEVFRPHRPAARWRWSEEVWTFLASVPKRAYCCQYRESDYAFIERLLGEEGLAWRWEEGPQGEQMVLFADSRRKNAVPRDPSCEAADGILYHRAHAGEERDAIQSVRPARHLTPTACTVLTYDYESKRVSSGSADSRLPPLKNPQDRIEQFAHPGHYVFGSPGEAQHYAGLRMQAHDVRAWRWPLRSTVRTLRAGTWFILRDSLYKQYGVPELAIERICSVGFNNLPESASTGVEALFGPGDAALVELFDGMQPGEIEAAFAQAHLTGYANCIDAFDANLTWRPLMDLEASSRPTADGSQSAVVVGPENAEVHTDALGRVRIRFHWQGPEDDSSCWVRVAQRSAGPGMGTQFVPRIGQEVMVQFFANDIDRPVIVGALYNGVGEGGIAPTPGGKQGSQTDPQVFARADDHARTGQGNLAGGHSPVWHGAAPDDGAHRNRAAQWGIRSKEFGVAGLAAGYNQLLFDDTDAQGRVQLKCSHAATELNMGHLIHTADNYRGSFRGTGIELRTDDYGCVRAGAGLLISSYAIAHGREGRDAAGDNGPGIALVKAALQMAESFSMAALTHQTVGLAAHLGSVKAGASQMDDSAAPLPALHKAMAGMVGTASVDAALAGDSSGAQVPHTTAPIIAIAAQGGLGVVAGQDIQLCSGETVSLMSGQDTQFVSGGQMHLHTGQAIGMLGGAVGPGDDGLGLQLIAAQGAVELQAQSDELKIQARDEVNIISANAHIDWAAAKKISLSTAGGANITIEGGNITIQCPGKIMVHAGTKSFCPASRANFDMPHLPRSGPAAGAIGPSTPSEDLVVIERGRISDLSSEAGDAYNAAATARAGGDSIAAARYEEIGEAKIELAREILAPYVSDGDLKGVMDRLDVSSPRDGGFFWSGYNEGALSRAAELAHNAGGISLETTRGGRVVNDWSAINNSSDVAFKDAFWSELSKKYADGVQGTINVVHSDPAFANGGGGVWKHTELKTIVANKQVTEAIFRDLDGNVRQIVSFGGLIELNAKYNPSGP